MAKNVDILSDGTLVVNSRHYDKTKRVLVEHGKRGTLYYPDGDDNEWIPVSERLPEPNTFVNATCRSLIDDRDNWTVETFYSPIP